MADADGYCAEQVRAQDHDRYLTALYAPAQARVRLMALYAFNLELARIRESVSEPMLGEIRLTWWHEALDGIAAAAPRQHPVVEAVAAHVAPHVPPELMTRMIEGREIEVFGGRPAQLDDLVAFTGATGGTLQEAAAYLLIAGKPARRLAEGCAAVGCTWSLLGLMDGLALQSRAALGMVPGDALLAAGIDAQTLYQGPLPEEAHARLAGLVRMLGEAATDQLAQARLALAGAPPSTRPAWLLAGAAAQRLKRWRKSGFALSPEASRRHSPSPIRTQFDLLLAAMTGRF